jgi:sulfonate transport system permease protein
MANLISNPVAISTPAKLSHVSFSLIKAKGRIGSVGLSLLLPAGLIALWGFTSAVGITKATILPSPVVVWDTFYEMLLNGSLAENLNATVTRVIKGFIIGAFAGVVLGAFMGIFPKMNRIVAVLFGILMPIPMVGWVPMLILWCGIGEATKVIVIAIGTFWSVLINTHDGIKNVDKKLIEVAEILEKGRMYTLLKVVLPASLPSVITGIRLGIGNAWKSVVAAEMLAASRGIGFIISYSRMMSQPDVMLVGLLSIGFVGVLIDRVTLVIQKWTLRWNVGAS